jgi:hypothetical protein
MPKPSECQNAAFACGFIASAIIVVILAVSLTFGILSIMFGAFYASEKDTYDSYTKQICTVNSTRILNKTCSYQCNCDSNNQCGTCDEICYYGIWNVTTQNYGFVNIATNTGKTASVVNILLNAHLVGTIQQCWIKNNTGYWTGPDFPTTNLIFTIISPIIMFVGLIIVCFIIIIIIMCLCFFHQSCYVYKYIHRHDNIGYPEETTN